MCGPRSAGKLPAVLVIHENRGLNPYIEDVARRLGTANFMAFAPDGLTSVGGYPGDDEKGGNVFGHVDRNKMGDDFIASAKWLKARTDCTGKIGAVGFCFGGGVVNNLAVRLGRISRRAFRFTERSRTRRSAEDQGSAGAAICLAGHAHQWRLARVRSGSQGEPRPYTAISRRRPTTASTTTRLPAMTKPPRSWRGSARSITSTSTCGRKQDRVRNPDSRVQPADIDELGHVNNITYLRWVQDVAVAHWRTVAAPADHTVVVWVVVRHEIDYRRPAFNNDEIIARTWVGVATRATFERHTEYCGPRTASLLAKARTLWCPVDPESRRPVSVSASVRAAFSVPSS